MEQAGRSIGVIDCFGMMYHEMNAGTFELGCEVKALGRGHVQRIKQAVREKAPIAPASRASTGGHAGDPTARLRPSSAVVH